MLDFVCTSLHASNVATIYQTVTVLSAGLNEDQIAIQRLDICSPDATHLVSDSHGKCKPHLKAEYKVKPRYLLWFDAHESTV